MPTYVCSAAAGRLTPIQEAEIVRSITAIHHRETGAPRYLVQVIFYDVAPGNHYVAGRSDMGSSRYPGRTDRRAEEPDAPTDNAGRRQGQRRRRGRGLNLPVRHSRSEIAEYGRVLPPPRGGGRMGSRRYPMPCGRG